jgi:hypothetical protein
LDEFRVILGKKFVWDGEDYASESDAVRKAEEYKKNNFETELIKENGNFYVFTRRLAKDIVIEGEPL